jgi:hypothetical protein
VAEGFEQSRRSERDEAGGHPVPGRVWARTGPSPARRPGPATEHHNGRGRVAPESSTPQPGR